MMSLLLKSAAMFALLAASPTVAPHSTLYSDGTPPTRFQGDNMAFVLMVDPSSIGKLCGTTPGYTTLACTHTDDGKPSVIAMPNPCDIQYDYYAHLLCHELGHVNGWPATHGD